MTNYYLFSYMIMFMLMTILMIIAMNLIHPIFIIIMMILYNIMLCLFMSQWKLNYLFSILFFLIMITGLMIMMLYFSSLISNEMNRYMFKKSSLLTIILNLMMTVSMYLIYNYYFFSMMNMDNLNFIMLNNNKFSNNFIYMYKSPMINLTLISMIYLMITMISIIKICSPKISSMRKLN